ncbi:hypothetical protein THTE_2170 [Thermogutta terrifontis]|jgi:hypothetical protein|uniref:Uncharacterized protein n=1 Tax=Thermogutta terrifontis TaxID=1331910 RepID=A0A286RFQ1_9BACT|nr:hypothetical protein THTE_2170 [Thermogutta terrifontis]
MWSAAIHRRFIVKALAFTILAFAVFCRNHESVSPVGAIHEWPVQHIGFVTQRGFLQKRG